MKNLKLYTDFIEDIILEQIFNDEINFIITDRLFEILEKIKHPIAEKLRFTSYTAHLKKQTLIDIVDGEYDFFYFVNSSKAIEYLKKIITVEESVTDYYHLKKYEKEILEKYKSKIKIAKLINKLFPNEFKLNGDPGNDIESFVNEYKSEFIYDDTLFELVSGKDVQYWYNEHNYEKIGDSTLNNSCMRYTKCYDYINFYAINPDKVKMLIKYSDDTKEKISGRALIWKLDTLNGEHTNYYFMDRIYYNSEKILSQYIAYAKHHKYIYKFEQNSNVEVDINVPEIGLVKKAKLEVYNIICDKNNLNFPFLDTLHRYNPFKKILTNDEKTSNTEYASLESTFGESKLRYSKKYDEIFILNGEWIKMDEDWIKEEDSVRILPENKLIDKDNIPDNYIYSSHNDVYIKKEYAIYVKYLDDYIYKSYIDNSFKYSAFYDDYIKENDVMYSNYMKDYIFKKDAIKVYIDANRINYYTTVEDDPAENFYKYDNHYYSNTVNKKDIKN